MSVIVWSKDDCPYCDRAKALLGSRNIEYEERKIGRGWTREDLLAAVPGARSVPQIIMNDELVGGFQELQRKLG